MKLKLLFLILFSVNLFAAYAAETPVKSVVSNASKNPVVLGQNYPNPAKGRTVINVEFSGAEAILRVYNVLGKLVQEIVISNEKKTITLDVSDFQEGIYLYSIEADGQKVTKRMTVSK